MSVVDYLFVIIAVQAIGNIYAGIMLIHSALQQRSDAAEVAEFYARHGM